MIDSINWLIKDIEYLDFKHLSKQGIYCEKFTIKSKNFIRTGYRFKKNEIEFKYYKSFKNIIVIANAHKVLNKRDVLLSDKDEYMNRVNETVAQILNIDNFKLILHRIDIMVDLEINEAMKAYMDILSRYKVCYKYMKQNKVYTTSNYLTTKAGQTTMNFYSRYEHTQNEEDRGILRLEVQNKPRRLKNLLKNFGEARDIDNYWSISAMNEYFFEYLKGYFYEGDYYKREETKTIINNSKLKESYKKKLNKFIMFVNKYGISGVIERKIYCNNTVNKYIGELNKLKINAILIEDVLPFNKLENLLNMAKRVAEEKYFK